MHWLRSPWAAVLLVALSHHAWAVCGRTCANSPEGCDEGFGTLAYVVTTCRVVGTNLVGAQELRVHHAGCDPITVVRLANPEPVVDPAGLCTILGHNHLGVASTVAGVFQRLGVTPDGTGIVFEITNAFQLVGQTPLAPEQQGFFYVRADGTGLRRLGPATRDPTYRLYVAPGGVGAEAHTRIAFSADNRRIAFTDLAPGPDGVETEQLFAMELATGERRQVTHLTAGGTPPRPGRKIIDDVNFVTPTTLIFIHLMGDDRQANLIELDGTGLRPQPMRGLSLDGDSHVVQTIERSKLHFSVLNVSVPGPPANADILPYWGLPTDVFSRIGNRHLVQLTNYRYGETIALSARRHAVLFMASADPLGTNPFHNCQLFRISPLGLGLRQATRFDPGRRSEEGCQFGALPGCAIRDVNESRTVSDTAPAFSFYSDCDPFASNPNGSQVFTVHWDGSEMRQLTHTRGVTTGPDGSVVEVEIPGPVARGGPG